MSIQTASAISPEMYGRDYFERGLVKGISGYMNYTWMPESTLRMTHFLVSTLGITPDDSVLDFGCAKGFLVRALRLFDIPAYGVDISGYAISKAPSDISEYCSQISSSRDLLNGRFYNWVLAKDVLEHLSSEQIDEFLNVMHEQASHLFLAIPLGRDNTSGKFVIPAYDNDISHITAKTQNWWQEKFQNNNWAIKEASHFFKGMKENWTQEFPDGNIFFILTRSS